MRMSFSGFYKYFFAASWALMLFCFILKCIFCHLMNPFRGQGVPGANPAKGRRQSTPWKGPGKDI